MAKSMSLVFSGDDYEEIKAGVLDYLDSLKASTEEFNDDDLDDDEPKPKKKKKKAAKPKKAAKKKKAVVDDDDDDFGDDDDENGGASDDDDDLDGEDDDDDNSSPDLVDVRDALGELSSVRKPAVAKKVLQRYGDVDRLEDLKEELYAKVIEKANKLVAKAQAVA